LFFKALGLYLCIKLIELNERRLYPISLRSVEATAELVSQLQAYELGVLDRTQAELVKHHID
jgi:hypothetical protein